MALTNEQLLMLDTLIYVDDKYLRDGATVRDILRSIVKDGCPIEACQMSQQEWTDLVVMMAKEPELLDYTIQHYNNNERTGMRAACFVDDVADPGDVNVVFRGTANDFEWYDNGQGACLSDTYSQIMAAAYVQSLPQEFGNAITVSGHSKGGNKAQYTTIRTNRVSRCVSYDGQGFSEEFIEKYSKEIAEKSSRIESISAANDPVNSLLYPIANAPIYLQTEDLSNPIAYHKPNILMDNSGKLRGKTKQSQLSYWINEYSTFYASNLPDPLREQVVKKIMDVVIFAMGSSEDGRLEFLLKTAFDDISGNQEMSTNLKSQLKSSEDAIKRTRMNTVSFETIIVPVSTLQHYAKDFIRLADENEDVFDRIYNSLQSMEASGEWKGESLTAAVTATQENREKFSDTIDEMHKLAAFLKKYADEMAAKDAELKRRIESVG